MNRARILIVEDELIVAEDLKMTLATLGYEVAGVSPTGEHAIELAGEKRPDVILMDIMLAGTMDGIATAEKIRALYDIPVIYVTAYADEKLIARAKLTEPFGYIVKPFNEREVHSNIEISLYRHRMEQEVRKRDAILLGLGSGIEWFLREFITSHRILKIPSPRPSSRPVYHSLLENIGNAMDLRRIEVFRTDPGEGGALSLAGEWTAEGSASLLNVPDGQHIDPARFGFSNKEKELKQGRAVQFGIEEFEPSLKELFRSYRFRSMVVLELLVFEEKYGAVFFVSDKDRVWSSEELEAMRIAANIIGCAIGLSEKDG